MTDKISTPREEFEKALDRAMIWITGGSSANAEQIRDARAEVLHLYDEAASRSPAPPLELLRCKHCHQARSEHCVDRCPDGGGYWKPVAPAPMLGPDDLHCPKCEEFVGKTSHPTCRSPAT